MSWWDVVRAEGLAVLLPSLLTLGLIVWITAVRLKEVPASHLPLDRKFMVGLAYSGALLAIYLSCLYLWRLSQRE